ncbi:hypothetical protein BACCIP111883_01741 [Sutcliffiella rhizosphaerae]|uniref:Uncharacterized protein n=1 Tax=Sutcliffiella rhizosphaerae TaxID=2880967 RepID=A0ABM8YLX4_9BACI|nr:hypothetical protein BACCIP111883_01741 [Sutcliffiella rhizosphaerae]
MFYLMEDRVWSMDPYLEYLGFGPLVYTQFLHSLKEN